MGPSKDNQGDATSQPLSSLLRSRTMSRAVEQLGPCLAVLAGPNDHPMETAAAIVAMYLAVPIAKTLGVGLARRIEALLGLPQTKNEADC